MNAPRTGVAMQAIWKRSSSFGLQPPLLLKRLQAGAWRGKPTARTIAGTEAHRQFLVAEWDVEPGAVITSGGLPDLS